MPKTTLEETTLADRCVVRLSGDGARDFLQGLVTSDVAGALPVWAGLLSPQGKCLFDFLVFAEGEDVLLDCEAAASDDLIKRLLMYRLRRAIVIARDDGLAVHWSIDGEESPDPRLAALGRRWLGASTKPAQGWLEQRLRLGVCEGRAELGDLLWLECNADELHGVSFSKGCFVGQENTARMNWRSKVNRRLFVVPTGVAPDARVRMEYPEIGLAVAHLRVDEIPQEAVRPEWMRA